MQRRVVQHGRADAELAVLGHEDVVVHAALASLPEGVVVRQLVEGDGHVAQLGVHLHHRRAAGQAGYLGCTIRPEVATYCLLPQLSM